MSKRRRRESKKRKRDKKETNTKRMEDKTIANREILRRKRNKVLFKRRRERME